MLYRNMRTILILATTQAHSRARRFRDKGFHLFDLMAEIMPSQTKGAHIFRPGGKRSRKAGPQSHSPGQPSEPPASSMPPPSAVPTPTPVTSQAVAPDSTVSPSRNISSPPSAPSSFLSPSGAGSDSSSVLTSVSRGKRKVSAISASVESNAGSEISRKRVRGPSVAATVQAENAESMKQLSHTVEEISKTLVTSGITTNNDIWQHAVTVLNSH